jgi:AGCS family alanine or glycine:cation symporter
MLMKQAVTMGFKRGVFSNEAGLGSSVMVHAASDVKEPVIQGMWGIFEVFFDTMIVCTLTAFTILSTGVLGMTDASGKLLEGVDLVTVAFSEVFHSSAGILLSLAILLFAFSTVLGWSFYGVKSLEYLFGEKAAKIYRFLFVVFIVVGATMDLGLAWTISDTLNGMMAIPNLIGVLVLSGTVFQITKNYSARKLSKKRKNITPMVSAYPDIQRKHAAEILVEEASVRSARRRR